MENTPRTDHTTAGPQEDRKDSLSGNEQETLPATKRILVAEDNIINQKLIHRLLSSRGFHFMMVENGLEVLEALEKESFDLVLLDLQMPELDGFETVRRIRKGNRDRLPPIIALSGHSEEADRQRCLAAGMQDHLAKPFKIEDLFRIIAIHLNNNPPQI